MKTVNIYGAGLSGLVSAINLAREGYKVTVYEKESRVGGSSKCHPSIHMTPIDLQKTKEYIGIDVAPCFSELEDFRCYFYSNIITFNNKHLYVTERGPNKNSLDNYLYEIASNEGVDFCFSQPLTPESFNGIADNSIISTGTYSLLCKHLNIPHLKFKHAIGYAKSEKKNTCLIYFDKYAANYGYISIRDGLLSASVSLRMHMPDDNLKKFEKAVRETEGIEFSKWSVMMDNFPTKVQLFTKVSDKPVILAGAISGFFDPLFVFGVNGALISGKIAALAVISKKRAMQEYKPFFTKLNKMFLVDTFYRNMPFRQQFLQVLLNIFPKQLPILKGDIQSIPGFTHKNSLEIQSIKNRF